MAMLQPLFSVATLFCSKVGGDVAAIPDTLHDKGDGDDSAIPDTLHDE